MLIRAWERRTAGEGVMYCWEVWEAGPFVENTEVVSSLSELTRQLMRLFWKTVRRYGKFSAFLCDVIFLLI